MNSARLRRLAATAVLARCVGACSSPGVPGTDSSSSAGTTGALAGASSSSGSSANASVGGAAGAAGAAIAEGGNAGTKATGGNATGGNATGGQVGGNGSTGGDATSGGGTGGGQAGTAAGGAAGAGGSGLGELCPTHAQLCLDFENGAFAGWNKKESGGTVGVDKTHFSHGAQALLISVPVGQAGGMIENHGAPLFPLPQKQLWGRMMVYFEGVPDGHTDLARGNGGNGGPNYNVGEQHDSIMLNYYAGSSATDCWARPKPEKKVPDKTWMCWEWRFDSAKNQMDFWMDGALLRSVDMKGDGCLTGNGVWQAPPTFESISVGELIAERSNSTAYKAWIDDVAVSNSARVGCPGAP